MKDILSLANEFYSEAKSDESAVQVKLAAGRKNRKQLEKDLAYAKDVYQKRRNALLQHQKSHADLAAAIDRETKDVERTRAEINKVYDVLRNMDLHDIQEVRFLNDDVGYVRNRRIYKLDDSHSLVPWRKKMESQADEDAMSVDDVDSAADELLASLSEY